MSREALLDNSNGPVPHEVEEDAIDPALIREELRRIVSSRHFQTSRRGTEFLQYVVNQKISGNGDLLKERLIGAEIFGRKPDYSTGDDPVVRVQAGDVRRRLERYHADPELQPDILIQIPLGSYAPVFQLRRPGPGNGLSAADNAKAVPSGAGTTASAHPQPDHIHDLSADERLSSHGNLSAESLSEGARPERQSLQDNPPDGAYPNADATLAAEHRPRGRATLKLAAVAVIACLAIAAALFSWYRHRLPDQALKAFWAPASVSPKPVLLCLPRPMVYRPSDKLFDRYGRAHPNAFATREARQDQILSLEPTDPIEWGDMVPVRSAGPGIGGVVAAINMSRLLTEQGIRFELRFGKEATYAEMRDSPVLVIGGINTEWATQLISETSFAFDETRGSPNIHETAGTKRVWKQETSEGHVTRDYGLITRQLSGRAGQFLVQVAGISHFGTAAASELLVQPHELEKVLHSESVSLQKKNLQIVVSTDVTDERAGPPHVVAVSSW